ncbi:MAG: hypothetical protein CEE43_12340 [Promethearchaeota archaeon Loki_b32]|nr:MAG: hypothetical protein CEE43_12340 [Candidatus Lokiarchaeota archaeon Loki_b32]
MNELICHIAPLGKKTDWIKEGLLYFDWNYLIILIKSQKEYIDLANKLKEELNPSFKIEDDRKLDLRIKKEIEIIAIKNRDIINFIKIFKEKAKEFKKLGYKIYFNATSGLELWKFAAYFIGTTENLIDNIYYIPKDSNLSEPIKPLEIYMPVVLSNPLKNLFSTLNEQIISQKRLVEETGFSKGLISRYLNNLREMGLIEISKKKKGKERFFEITEKGKWYL